VIKIFYKNQHDKINHWQQNKM